MSRIPVIDLAVLEGSDGAARRAAGRALIENLSTYGLAPIFGHGIDDDHLEGFYRRFRAFTDRPAAEKARLGGAHIWHQRGWTPPDTERAVIAGGQPDFKECYFVAPIDVDPACRVEYPEIFADNVWPDDAEALRDGYLALGRRLHAIGLVLLEACAEALTLPVDTFTRPAEGASHVTRALKYLPLGAEQVGRVVWGEEHTDFNLLTLLPGGRFYDPRGQRCASPDPDAGLYLRTRPTAQSPAGTRVRGAAPPGCMLVQVGQALEILTGGRLLATPHVITAPKQPGYTRCSMAHFIHVHPHTVLQPRPEFLTPTSRAAYRPTVLAGTYSLKTLVDIGLAPAAALDQLGYRHYDRLAGQRASE